MAYLGLKCSSVSESGGFIYLITERRSEHEVFKGQRRRNRIYMLDVLIFTGLLGSQAKMHLRKWRLD